MFTFCHCFDKISRKIDADIFIDDRNVGGFIGWSDVWQMIHILILTTVLQLTVYMDTFMK